MEGANGDVDYPTISLQEMMDDLELDDEPMEHEPKEAQE